MGGFPRRSSGYYKRNPGRKNRKLIGFSNSFSGFSTTGKTTALPVFEVSKAILPRAHALCKLGPVEQHTVLLKEIYRDAKVIHMKLHGDDTMESLVAGGFNKSVAEFNQTHGKVEVPAGSHSRGEER